MGLVHALASTSYGRDLGIQSPKDLSRRKDFVKGVPMVHYDDLKPWIMTVSYTHLTLPTILLV